MVCVTQISVLSIEFMGIKKGFLNLKSFYHSKYSVFWLGYIFKQNEQDRAAEVHGKAKYFQTRAKEASSVLCSPWSCYLHS